jgi:hypothetical protein
MHGQVVIVAIHMYEHETGGNCCLHGCTPVDKQLCEVVS